VKHAGNCILPHGVVLSFSDLLVLVAIASNRLPGHGRSGAAIGGHFAVLATAFLGIGEWSISSTQMAIAVTIGFGVMLVPVGFLLGFAVDNALMLLFRRGRT
jgi:hypothetical protein